MDNRQSPRKPYDPNRIPPSAPRPQPFFPSPGANRPQQRPNRRGASGESPWVLFGQILNGLVQFISAVILFFGMITVNIADVVAGGFVLSLIFKNDIPFGSLVVSGAFFGMALSLATSFIQAMVWMTIIRAIRNPDRLFNSKFGALQWVAIAVGLLVGVLVMVMDTQVDVSVLEYLTKIPAGDPLDFSMAGTSVVYRAVVFMLTAVLAGGEFFTSLGIALIGWIGKDR